MLDNTFYDQALVNCAVLTVLGHSLVRFATVPILRCLCGWELRYHDSLNGIAFQDFMFPVSHQDFNWMSFHCRFNSSPVGLKFFLIQCFCSRENEVSRHD